MRQNCLLREKGQKMLDIKVIHDPERAAVHKKTTSVSLNFQGGRLNLEKTYVSKKALYRG